MEKAKFELGPLQTKWLEALESGEWMQTTDVLKRPNAEGKYSYCCLGVLCELAGLEWRETRGLGQCNCESCSALKSHKFVFGNSANNGSLPEGFAETVGLRNNAGAFANKVPMKYGGLAPDLASLNDTFGYTFKQIAEVIRADPENVFTHSA
jgi:hypothetical protein